jgi:hypothetical protein
MPSSSRSFDSTHTTSPNPVTPARPTDTGQETPPATARSEPGVTVLPDGWSLVTAPVHSASWSPDSKHFLVALATKVIQSGVDPIFGFEIRNSDGGFVTKLADEDPVGWLDDTHVLAYEGLGDSSDEAGYAGNAHASIIDIAGGDAVATNVPYGEGPLVSGNGAVAIPRFHGYVEPNVPKYDFVVWSNGALSGPHQGYPFAWSRDGSKLAIWHSFEPTRGPDGWLEVVTWPTLQTVYEDLPHQQIGSATFDPAGEHIAFERFSNETDVYPPTYIRIAALDGASAADLPEIPPQTGVGWFWNRSVLKTIVAGQTTETSWAATGSLVASRTPPGQGGESSQDGSTAIYWSGGDADPVQNFIVEHDGGQNKYNLPSSPVDFPPGILAPDGSAIVVVGDGALYVRKI